jgi:hypothetical protein
MAQFRLNKARNISVEYGFAHFFSKSNGARQAQRNRNEAIVPYGLISPIKNKNLGCGRSSLWYGQEAEEKWSRGRKWR